MREIATEGAGALTSKDYWRAVWSGLELPYVARPQPDIARALTASLPRGDLRLLEVGCAPGGWMAFFHREFGYRVEGVDYVPQAARLARKNLELLAIDGEVVCGDLFQMEENQARYEVVFSGGFIEHFEETDAVVARIANLSSGHVVTLVPNLYGINGAICRVFQRDVYDKHVRLDPSVLRRAHEKAGLHTRVCRYAGGLRIIEIAVDNPFFAKHPRLAAAINRPVDYLNQVLRKLDKWIGFPRSARWWSPSVLYVGQRTVTAEGATHP